MAPKVKGKKKMMKAMKGGGNKASTGRKHAMPYSTKLLDTMRQRIRIKSIDPKRSGNVL